MPGEGPAKVSSWTQFRYSANIGAVKEDYPLSKKKKIRMALRHPGLQEFSLVEFPMDPDWGSNADENIGHREEKWAEKVKVGLFEQDQHLRTDRTLYRKITIKGVLEINRESVRIGENRPNYEFYLCVMLLLLFPLFFHFLFFFFSKSFGWCVGITVFVKDLPEVWPFFWVKSPRPIFMKYSNRPPIPSVRSGGGRRSGFSGVFLLRG